MTRRKGYGEYGKEQIGAQDCLSGRECVGGRRAVAYDLQCRKECFILYRDIFPTCPSRLYEIIEER